MFSNVDVSKAIASSKDALAAHNYPNADIVPDFSLIECCDKRLVHRNIQRVLFLWAGKSDDLYTLVNACPYVLADRQFPASLPL